MLDNTPRAVDDSPGDTAAVVAVTSMLTYAAI